MTVAFVPYEFRRGGRPPLVTRTVALPAGASTRFTLPVPLTSVRSDGRVVVVADPLSADGAVVADERDARTLLAAAIPEFVHEASPPTADSNAIRSPSVLVLEGAAFDRRGFSFAASAMLSDERSYVRRSSGRGTSGGHREDVLVLPSEALPETLAAFATVDVLVADPRTLAELPQGVRQAVRDWLAAGGTLAVADVLTDAAAPLPAATRRVLGLGPHSGDDWVAVAEDGSRDEPARSMMNDLPTFRRRGGRRFEEEFADTAFAETERSEAERLEAERLEAERLTAGFPVDESPAAEFPREELERGLGRFRRRASIARRWLAPRRLAVGGGRIYAFSPDGGGAGGLVLTACAISGRTG